MLMRCALRVQNGFTKRFDLLREVHTFAVAVSPPNCCRNRFAG